MSKNISIHAPREGSDHDRRIYVLRGGISIHAPREGSDRLTPISLNTVDGISIHAPREGSDLSGRSQKILD